MATGHIGWPLATLTRREPASSLASRSPGDLARLLETEAQLEEIVTVRRPRMEREERLRLKHMLKGRLPD